MTQYCFQELYFLGPGEHHEYNKHFTAGNLDYAFLMCSYFILFFYFFSFSTASITAAFDQLSQPHFGYSTKTCPAFIKEYTHPRRHVNDGGTKILRLENKRNLFGENKNKKRKKTNHATKNALRVYDNPATTTTFIFFFAQ